METEKQTCGWFVFNSGQVLIEKKEDGYHIPYGPEPPVEVPVGSTIHTIGEINGYPAKTYAIHIPVSGDENSPRMMKDLRASFDVLPLEEYKRGGKASQILNWDKNSRYCPMCGVLIKKEDSILLVHARNFRGTFKGLVAGFLEPGETLEECVHREVMEETGLTIKNLKYFGSQPWPYPSGIMVGYYAEYESGTIKLQDEELSAGAFYNRNNLPEIPKKLSIARQLIDAWLDNKI